MAALTLGDMWGLQLSEGVPAEAQVLTCNGKLLQEGQLAYDIANQATVHLTSRLRGGKPVKASGLPTTCLVMHCWSQGVEPRTDLICDSFLYCRSSLFPEATLRAILL
jgi:hypothetical protein